MRRVCTSVCLAAGLTTTGAAFAEQQTLPVTGTGNPGIRDVTVTGCVAPASESNRYVIDVIEDRNDPSTPPGGGVAPGTALRLVGLPPEDFQDYVGQHVEVFGMLLASGSSHGRGHDGDEQRKAKLGVRYIRQLAATCPASLPAARSAAPGPDGNIAFNHGRGNGRRGRDAANRIPAAAPNVTPGPSGTAQPVTSTPPAAGARPVSNTSATPAFLGPPVSNGTTGTAPSN